MQVFHTVPTKAIVQKPVIFCFGVFDGIHKGHQMLLQEAKRVAGSDALVALFSFSSSPKLYLSLAKEQRITTLYHKEKLLQQYGVDILLHIPFTQDVRNCLAKQFLDQMNVLFPITTYIVGEDVSFGSHAQGNLAFLCNYAKTLYQDVLSYRRIEGISSTLIRKKIAESDFLSAHKLLGRTYSILGSFKKTEEGYLLEDSFLCLPENEKYFAQIFQEKNEYFGTVLIKNGTVYVVLDIELEESTIFLEIFLLKKIEE